MHRNNSFKYNILLFKNKNLIYIWTLLFLYFNFNDLKTKKSIYIFL